MAITDKKVPYEILVRFDDTGIPKGAHVLNRRIVVMDGEILKDEILPAAPLDLEGFPTSDFMTNATRDALANVSMLNKSVDALTETVTEREVEIELLKRDKEQLSNQLEAAAQEVSRLSTEFALMRELIEQLKTTAVVETNEGESE